MAWTLTMFLSFHFQLLFRLTQPVRLIYSFSVSASCPFTSGIQPPCNGASLTALFQWCGNLLPEAESRALQPATHTDLLSLILLFSCQTCKLCFQLALFLQLHERINQHSCHSEVHCLTVTGTKTSPVQG